MNKIFLFLSLVLLGCHSDSTKVATSPLNGMHQFEVALFFLPSQNFDQESFFKTVIASFEKIGVVSISQDDVYAISNSLPVLLLSYGIQDDRSGSMVVFAETEVLINRYRLGSQIWKEDFNCGSHSVFPEITGEGIVFRKSKEPEENVNPQQMVEKMIEQFAKTYHEANEEKPTFYIHSKLL